MQKQQEIPSKKNLIYEIALYLNTLTSVRCEYLTDGFFLNAQIPASF